MQALIVVAHPCADSFAHAAAARARAGLEAAGHAVTTVDLYAERFAPAMSQAERAAYHTPRPALDDLAIAHGELLRSAQVLVFVYPTWWSGLPAMLKGWIDKVMVPGLAFTLHDDGRGNEHGKVRPGLTQVRRIVGISTYGSPRLYVAAMNDNGRRILTRALRMSCGLRARTTWMGLYAMDTRSDADRAGFLDRIEHKMRSF